MSQGGENSVLWSSFSYSLRSSGHLERVRRIVRIASVPLLGGWLRQGLLHPHKRRMHLTDKHIFPKVCIPSDLHWLFLHNVTYNQPAIHLIDLTPSLSELWFQIINTRLDKRSFMLRSCRSHSSTASRALQRRSSLQHASNAEVGGSSSAPPAE